MFNAIKYTEELEKAGFTRSQAEMSVKLLVDVMNENFATRSDLSDLKLAFKADLADLRTELKTEIGELRTELKTEIARFQTEVKSEIWRLDSKIQSLESGLKEMEYKLTIKLGTMMTIAIGVTATLMRLIPTH